MSKGIKKLFSLILLCALSVSMLTACSKETDADPTDGSAPTVTEAAKTDPTEGGAEPTKEPEGDNSKPLVVGIDTLSQKFSPYYWETGYDREISDMTQMNLMVTDRLGGIIFNAIEGETIEYNGTDHLYKGPADLSVSFDEKADVTTYTAKLRDDIKFSDGTPMTADDIIFNYYVYLDPSFDGLATFESYNIIGAKDYQTQTTSELFTKYEEIVSKIYKAGKDHTWSSSDAWTQEQQTAFWTKLDTAWSAHTQFIVDYVLTNLGTQEYVDSSFDATMKIDDIKATEGLSIAYAMAMYGYGEMKDGVLTAPSGATFDVAKAVYPTLEDFTNETKAKYENDPVVYFETEKAGEEDDVYNTAANACITEFSAAEPELEGGVPNISGIKKLDEYTVEIKTQGYQANVVYGILGLQIAPLHYYGDASKFDYENNKFGFDFGDLKSVRDKTSAPMGAGPYKFLEYTNKVVYYEANENYFKGAPKVKNLQYKEVLSPDVAAAVKTGTVDIAELDGTNERFKEVQGYNSNGEISGDVITTSKVDNLGYGYIGISAKAVAVNDAPDSEESRNLRKGLATIISVYRDTAIDSYYGEAASVIQYPISNTSWAAPQATDEGFKNAFSVDVDGNDIYTTDMAPEAKYAAALEAAIGYFKAAGYTFDEASKKFTAAPSGAKMSYEIIIPADGKGDHPAFAILTDAKAALASIGIELKINDPADSNILWDALNANTQELWCAAWGAVIDPDMYQIYHSSNVPGLGGSNSNRYNIVDEKMDQLILDARRSDDQSFRKSTYKEVLDIIADWAVEVPTYQRQNCIVFSTERINLDTVTSDITTFWKWYDEIEKLEMK